MKAVSSRAMAALGTALWLLGAGKGDGATLYVATNGFDTLHTNWSTAYTNLQTALDAAGNGDTVYLAGHTFTVTNQLAWSNRLDVFLLGSYEATNDSDLPGPCNPALWPTVLTRGASTNRLLYVENITNGTLSGLVFSNGYLTAGSGGGLYFTASWLTLENCVLVSNALASTGGDVFGGGLYATGGGGTLKDCTVRHNRVSSTYSGGSGGGVYVASGSWTITNSLFEGNLIYSTGGGGRAFGYGGGLYLAGGPHTLVHSRWSRNTASCQSGNADKSWGGGVHVAAGASATIRNCILSSNTILMISGSAYGGGLYLNAGVAQNCLIATNMATGGSGGGVYLGNASACLQNCTVVTNSISTGDGPGVYRTAGGVTNTIVHGNVRAGVATNIYGDINAFWYSCAPELTNIVNSNLTANPLFASPAAGDWRLNRHSLCIDAGMNQGWMDGAVDLDGIPRVQAWVVDMGAYETFPPDLGILFQLQ